MSKLSPSNNKNNIVLVGHMGSGKSTLLNLLSLIDRPTSGSISIENKQINFNNKKKMMF